MKHKLINFDWIVNNLIVHNLSKIATWGVGHAIGSVEMVVLKKFELSVNIESISFQTKVEHADDLWLAITKSHCKNYDFEVYAEKK